MKKSILSVALLLGVFAAASPLHAQLANFQGSWNNTNSGTRSLVRLVIRGTQVHPYAACHPSPCDWGELDAVAYGPSVAAAVQRSAEALVAIRHTSFSVVILMIEPSRNHDLKVSTFTRFTDNSGRAPYTVTEFFRRSAAPRGKLRPLVRERLHRR
ncbi:MAG: hypothetical protein P8Z30_08895 [Acidobacteriota bacterium]